MKLPAFEYAMPQSMEEFCKISAEEGHDAQIIAGGTDILAALKYHLKTPRTLIDICRLSGLDTLSYSDQEGLSIGSLVSLRHLAAHDTVRKRYPLLAQAALSVGSVQLQAMGTIGGNICQDTRCIYYNLPPMSRQGLDPCFKLGGEVCHAVKSSKICRATYAGDMAPALLALQATITITGSDGEKTIPLEDIYSGRGEAPHILKPGQIVKEIQVPPPHDTVGLYLKMRMRKSIDYPLLGVAVNLSVESKKRNLKNILIALTAVEKSPLLIRPPEEATGAVELEKQMDSMAQAAYSNAHPLANTSGYSPRYRREMVRVYVRQGIARAMGIVSGRGSIT
jgi:4-hydroxybenzoyl-CoA reductase subunit beta